MSLLLHELTEQQKAAVEAAPGPLLVIAGAGTGKTRVLTYRIAYLITALNVPPEHIMAITFTKKAAREMKLRLQILLPPKQLERLFIGTIHQAALLILRATPELHAYTLYDQDDQIMLLKEIIQKLPQKPQPHMPINAIIRRISFIKGTLGKLPVTHTEPAHDSPINAHLDTSAQSWMNSLFPLYTQKLDELKALDFDDIILRTVQLLTQQPSLLNTYQEQFRVLLVDEYQDINNAQYQFIRLLTEKHSHLFAIGDADQAIYRFRGADINNFLSFQKDFPQALCITLEHNFRSAHHILECANHLITHNNHRLAKRLIPTSLGKHKVSCCEVPEEHAEAMFIINTIQNSIGGSTLTHVDSGIYTEAGPTSSGYGFNDFAVLYRTRHQARILSEQLQEEGIPVHLYHENRFCDWPEIRTTINYLRLIVDPAHHIKNSESTHTPDFQILQRLREYSSTHTLNALLKKLFEETTLTAYYTQNSESGQRMNELLLYSHAYKEGSARAAINSFLGEILFSYTYEEREMKANCVSLMTLHAAKGLEFPVVFIVGVEKDILPADYALKTDDEHEKILALEEERRLFYVGITRAQQKLYLLHAQKRTLFGTVRAHTPSLFLSELPAEHIQRILYKECALVKKPLGIKKTDDQLSFW